MRPIACGEYVIKYGEIIGKATADISAGEWVHTHNVKSHLDENVAYRYEFNAFKPEKSTATFMGYKREKGRAGIRNEIYIIPTVGCVNNVCMRLAKEKILPTSTRKTWKTSTLTVWRFCVSLSTRQRIYGAKRWIF